MNINRRRENFVEISDLLLKKFSSGEIEGVDISQDTDKKSYIFKFDKGRSICEVRNLFELKDFLWRFKDIFLTEKEQGCISSKESFWMFLVKKFGVEDEIKDLIQRNKDTVSNNIYNSYLLPTGTSLIPFLENLEDIASKRELAKRVMIIGSNNVNYILRRYNRSKDELARFFLIADPHRIALFFKEISDIKSFMCTSELVYGGRYFVNTMNNMNNIIDFAHIINSCSVENLNIFLSYIYRLDPKDVDPTNLFSIMNGFLDYKNPETRDRKLSAQCLGMLIETLGKTFILQIIHKDPKKVLKLLIDWFNTKKYKNLTLDDFQDGELLKLLLDEKIVGEDIKESSSVIYKRITL